MIGKVLDWLGKFDVVSGQGFNPSEFQKDIAAQRVKSRERPVFKHLVEEHKREPSVWIGDRELDSWHAALHSLGAHEAAQRHGE